jgi:hypothetical protein
MELDNKTNTSLIVAFDDFVDNLTYNYIKPAISIYTFISNLLCAVVFSKILKRIRQNGNKMYYYFFIKSLCDMLFGLIESFYPLYGIESWSTSTSYLTNIWYIYLHKYLNKVLLMASSFLEIVASFDCAISMDNSLKWFQKWTCFIIVNLLILIFCFVYNSYILLVYDINKIYSLNHTVVEYDKHRNDDFFFSVEYIYLDLFNSLFRDVISIILLITINLYILINLKKIRKRKNRLQKNRKSAKNAIENRAEIAENRKVRMIYVLCLIYIFGHLPSVLYYLRALSDGYFTIIFYASTDIIYPLSYGTSIFVYYFFNNNFKSILNCWLFFNNNSIEPY